MKKGDVSDAVAKYSRPSRPMRSTTRRGPTGPWPVYAWATWRARSWMPAAAASTLTLRQMYQNASKLYLGAATLGKALAASAGPRRRPKLSN